MKLLIVLALAVAALLFYPQINEDTGSACAALERRVIARLPGPAGRPDADSAGRSVLGALVGTLSDGSLAATFVKQRHPNLPPFLGCAATYWRILLDPSQIRDMAREAGFAR